MTVQITKLKVALAVLVVALAIPATAYATHVFTDVDDNAFYAAPVKWASDNGITTGTGDGTTFSPIDPVTRGESVTFLKRYDDFIVQPALDTKADSSAVYTQAEVDALLAAKADAADVPEASVASATRTVELTVTGAHVSVVTANTSTSGTASLLVSAAVQAHTDGGDNDNINCRIVVDGTDGLLQSISIPDAAFSNQAVLTMTQVFPVGPGAHTVLVTCNQGVGSNSTIESASLVILAID